MLYEVITRLRRGLLPGAPRRHRLAEPEEREEEAEGPALRREGRARRGDGGGRILFDRGTTLYLDPLEILEFSQNDPEVLAVEGLDTKSNLSFSYYETGTSFEYEYIRLFYTKSREIEIEN